MHNPLTRQTLNSFCPTGKGGGVDPTCGKEAKFTVDQESLIRSYVVESVEGKEPPRMNEQWAAVFKEHGYKMKEGSLWRGTTEETVPEVGQVLRSENRHLPTSRSRQTAFDFLDVREEESRPNKVIWEIEAKGMRAFDIPSYLTEQDEGEVLLGGGDSKGLIIKSVKTDGPFHYVKAEWTNVGHRSS